MIHRFTLMTPLLIITCPLLAMAASAETALAAEPATWTMARADSGASGAIDHVLPANLRLLWETKTVQAIETTPVSDGELVFVADVMGGVEALDLKSGQSKWRREFDTSFVASPSLFLPASMDPADGATAQIPIIAAPPPDTPPPPGAPHGSDAAVEPDRALLVVGDVEGNIEALDPSSGETIWKFTTAGEISAAATFFAIPHGDGHLIRVLQSSQDGSLYCLDAQSGELVWKYETGDQIRCSASIAAGKTFFGGCDGQLHVIDLATGQAAREPVPLGGPTGSTPAVRGDELFLPTMGGVVFSLNPDSGDVRWQVEDPERAQEYRSSAAIGDDLIIVSSQNKHVDALDRATGERVWRKTLRRRADASPLIAGEDLWIASTAGILLRLSLADGEEKWSFEARGKFMASPAIVGDLLVIADDDGVVRCFGP